MNTIILAGFIGAEPEGKELAGGSYVCNFSIATSDGTKDRPQTNWHRIEAWNEIGKICVTRLTKGDKVTIEGRLVYRKYKNKDGVEVEQAYIILKSVELPKRGVGTPIQTPTTEEATPKNDDFYPW